MEKTTLGIVLPCYNPSAHWSERIVQAVRYIENKLPLTEISIYLVNDGSVRNVNAADIAHLSENLRFHFIDYQQNQGKGYALRQGVAACKDTDVTIFTDIDFPYQEDDLIALYEKIYAEKWNVLVGKRAENYYENVPKVRIFISKLLKFFIRFLLNIPINDTQCGLKGFDKVGREIFLATTINRYLFDLEFIYLAAKVKDIRLAAMEVQLKPGIIFSRMNMKILLTEGWNFLKVWLK